MPGLAKSAALTTDPELLKSFTAIAYRRYPTALLEALRSTLADPAAISAVRTLLQSLNPIWDAPIADILAEVGNDAGSSVAVQSHILASLLRHGDPRGAGLAARLRGEGTLSEQAIMAGREVLLSDDAASIAEWVGFLGTQQDLGRAVLLATASAEDRIPFSSAPLPPNVLKNLYLLTSDLFPPDDDSELLAGTPVPDDPRVKVGWLRDRLFGRLAGQGAWESVEEVEAIIALRPNLALPRELHGVAVQAALRNTWTPVEPIRSVLTIVQDSQHHIVRNADQLLDLVVESLGRLQRELVEENAAQDLWSEWGNPVRYRPKRELSFSDYVKRFLDRDLERYLVAANREVQNRRGNATDILVQCLVADEAGGPAQRFAVVVEAKGSWNPGLLAAMETQLAERYLREHEADRGVYLVGWYNCEAWDQDDSAKEQSWRHDLVELRAELARQASALSNENRRIEAVVLDAALRGV